MMQARRFSLKVVLAVMLSSCLLRLPSISSKAFVPNILRSMSTSLRRQSSRSPSTPQKRCTGIIFRHPYSGRPRQLPQPRPRRPHRPVYLSSSLSFSYSCQDPPSEGGGSLSSSTSKPSSLDARSESAQTGPRVSGSNGQGFGANSTDGAADRDSSKPSPQRQKSPRERRPKQQQQQPKAPPRGNNLLIVGLGNPGEQYRLTRHNAGFLVAEELARRHGGTLKIRTSFQGEYCSIYFKGKSVGILRPVTYMNNSGMAARKIVDFFKLPINAALVLVDEVALDFGKLRLKEKGGPGGHNGLKSIQAHLKTPNYSRLRIGIGACGAGPLSDHVLGEFTRSEKKELDSVIAEACDAVEHWIEEEDTAKVMTRFNGR